MAPKKKAVKKTIAEFPLTAAVDIPVPFESSIQKLPTDFGREDLNLMAAKINEIIEKHG